MINKRNLYNDNGSKIWKKNDFTSLFGILIVVDLLSVFMLDNKQTALIIFVIAMTFPCAIYFIKVYKKILSEKYVLKYIGILGVYNSVYYSVLFAYQTGTSVMEHLLVFVISICVIAVIILLQEIFSKQINKNTNHKNNSKAALFYVPFAVAGMALARYLKVYDIDILKNVAFAIMSIIFATFYNGVIRSRAM